MSGIEWCRTCGDLIFVGSGHVCPPGFRAWSPDLDQEEEDGHIVYARDHEQAAEKWAAWEDSYSADYTIVGGQEVTVHVRKLDEEDGPVKRFQVEGRSEPVYNARPLPETDDALSPEG